LTITKRDLNLKKFGSFAIKRPQTAEATKKRREKMSQNYFLANIINSVIMGVEYRELDDFFVGSKRQAVCDDNRTFDKSAAKSHLF
jgi:hypothetical protein